MEIKCPVCGKKYKYDRKICQECEDYSIYSGLAKVDGKISHKWNCAVYLGLDTITFKTGKISELTQELSPEPINLAVEKRNFYYWNCESINQLCKKEKRSLSPVTLGDFSTHVRNKTNSSLFYE